MRNEFIATLTEETEKNRNIILLTGDLGFSVFENFAQRFPKNYYNFGISEQNMMGAAAGLALSGKKVIAYSIATFATMRPFEQIRVDIAFQKANVIVVGVGSGFGYGSLAPTHHATEDISLMRTLPNMVVLCPGDPAEAILATRAAIAHNGPVYLRLGKGAVVHTTVPKELVLGKSFLMREGTDVTLISTGDVLPIAAAAAEQLGADGVSVRHISMPCIKPIDKEAILHAAKTTRVITIEEHQINGGLGSAVAEILAEAGSSTPLVRIGVPDRFLGVAGSQDYLRKQCGITVENIVKAAKG